MHHIQFRIFTKTSATLDFQNHKFLTPILVHKAQMHYHAKFRQNRSNGLGDMTIFWIFQDGGGLPFGFSNLRTFNADWLKGSQLHHHAKFHRNW